MVFGFDQFVKLLAQFWLNGSAEGAEAEAMARSAGGARVLFIRSDGECAVPEEG